MANHCEVFHISLILVNCISVMDNQGKLYQILPEIEQSATSLVQLSAGAAILDRESLVRTVDK